MATGRKQQQPAAKSSAPVPAAATSRVPSAAHVSFVANLAQAMMSSTTKFAKGARGGVATATFSKK
jgi:hypothetical protein